MKVLRSELVADRPKLDEALEFQGATYRITRAGWPSLWLMRLLGTARHLSFSKSKDQNDP